MAENEDIRDAYVFIHMAHALLAGYRCTDEPLALLKQALRGLEYAFPNDTTFTPDMGETDGTSNQ